MCVFLSKSIRRSRLGFFVRLHANVHPPMSSLSLFCMFNLRVRVIVFSAVLNSSETLPTVHVCPTAGHPMVDQRGLSMRTVCQLPTKSALFVLATDASLRPMTLRLETALVELASKYYEEAEQRVRTHVGTLSPRELVRACGVCVWVGGGRKLCVSLCIVSSVCFRMLSLLSGDVMCVDVLSVKGTAFMRRCSYGGLPFSPMSVPATPCRSVMQPRLTLNVDWA